MTPQELKNSILQLAIQGRLVEQRPEEGTAEELYRQIQREKAALVKAGKIKKEKPLPEITEEEVPFEIPEGWKWVHLGALLQVIGGVSYDKNDVANDGFRVLRGGNIQNMEIIVNEDDVFLPVQYKDEEKIVRVGDILIVASTGSKAVIGKAGYVNKPIPNTMIGAFLRICRPFSLTLVDYLRIIFESDFYRKHIRELAQGTNINNVKEAYITQFIVPLPPLPEQKRIVVKIEELLPLIDRYEKAWTRLEDFNKRFPADMQKSILQLAIQGRLVEQRAEEGTGEELYREILHELEPLIKSKAFKGKKQPALSDNELPFDIPDTWKWVRLGDIISIESGKNLTASQMVAGSVPVYGGNGITGYHNVGLVHKETVVIGRVGFYCGSIHVTEAEAWITDNAFITTFPEKSICREYLVYILRHMNLGKDNNATAQPVVSGKKIYPMAFPLPPLAEQKRIVAKLEELMPVCERLVNNC